MICKLTPCGKSFGTITEYCLREARREDRGDGAGRRVEWTETLNLPTDDPRRAARIMGGTAADAAELKRLAGVSAAGRKLEKPVLHYSLSWPPGQRPTQAQMMAAVRSSMQALGVRNRQALVVAHGDTGHPHAHVIVNRVDWRSGRAAGLGRSKRRLSRWAEGWERTHGGIVCRARAANNERRERAAAERERGGRAPGEYGRREKPRAAWDRERRAAAEAPDPAGWAAGREWRLEAEHVRPHLESAGELARDLARRSAEKQRAAAERRFSLDWGDLYRRQRQERESLEARVARARSRLEKAARKAGPRGLAKAAARRRREHGRKWARLAEALEKRHERERADLALRSRGLTGALRRWAGLQRRAEEGLGRRQADEREAHAQRRDEADRGIERSIRERGALQGKAPAARAGKLRELEGSLRELGREHSRQRAQLGRQHGGAWQRELGAIEARARRTYTRCLGGLAAKARQAAERERLERERRQFGGRRRGRPERSRERDRGWDWSR